MARRLQASGTGEAPCVPVTLSELSAFAAETVAMLPYCNLYDIKTFCEVIQYRQRETDAVMQHWWQPILHLAKPGDMAPGIIRHALGDTWYLGVTGRRIFLAGAPAMPRLLQSEYSDNTRALIFALYALRRCELDLEQSLAIQQLAVAADAMDLVLLGIDGCMATRRWTDVLALGLALTTMEVPTDLRGGEPRTLTASRLRELALEVVAHAGAALKRPPATSTR